MLLKPDFSKTNVDIVKGESQFSPSHISFKLSRDDDDHNSPIATIKLNPNIDYLNKFIEKGNMTCRK